MLFLDFLADASYTTLIGVIFWICGTTWCGINLSVYNFFNWDCNLPNANPNVFGKESCEIRRDHENVITVLFDFQSFVELS